jgi:hypothetical protein
MPSSDNPKKVPLAERLARDLELGAEGPQLSDEKAAAWVEALLCLPDDDKQDAAAQVVALALSLFRQWPEQCDAAVEQLMALASALVIDWAAVRALFADAGFAGTRFESVTGSAPSNRPVGLSAKGSSLLDVVMAHKAKQPQQPKLS